MLRSAVLSLIRLGIAARSYGGVYVDVDFVCVRPLDPLLEVCSNPPNTSARRRRPSCIDARVCSRLPCGLPPSTGAKQRALESDPPSAKRACHTAALSANLARQARAAVIFL